METLLRTGLADDFELQPLYPDRVYTSPEGMRELGVDALETWQDYRFDTEEMVDLGKHVLVMARMTGRGASSGVPIDQPVAVLVAFEGDQAVWAKSFLSKDEALGALGHQR